MADLHKDPEVLCDWLHIHLNVILASWPVTEAGICDLLKMRSVIFQFLESLNNQLFSSFLVNVAVATQLPEFPLAWFHVLFVSWKKWSSALFPTHKNNTKILSKGESFIISYVYPLEEAFTSGYIINLVLSRQAKIEYEGRITWIFDNAENG